MATKKEHLTIDARAELVARTAKGREPLDPASHPLLREAIGHAVSLAYLADLRPFARWVLSALGQGNRAGAANPPPSVRPEAAFFDVPTPRHDDLTTLAANAYQAAIDHGVGSREFRTHARVFAVAWKAVTVRVQLMTPAPAHREVDLFRLGLAHLLATLLPDDDFGPTTFALLLAAIGADEPIMRLFDEDTTADAIAARAEQCKELWQRGSQRARTANERFMLLPGRPIELRPGNLEPPYLHLPNGETVVRRPAGIPPEATVTLSTRNRRPWFVASWREGDTLQTVALAPAA